MPRETKRIHLKWDKDTGEWEIQVPGGSATPGNGPGPGSLPEVEIHHENPYWVKVGGRWYRIG